MNWNPTTAKQTHMFTRGRMSLDVQQIRTLI